MCYKFICPLLVEVNLELWTMRLVLSIHVGNVGRIGIILRLRVSQVVFHFLPFDHSTSPSSHTGS